MIYATILGCFYRLQPKLVAVLGKGYSNKYNLTMNNDSRVNLAPLRANGTVDKIIASYSYIFEQ